jgi:hypothetical protein
LIIKSIETRREGIYIAEESSATVSPLLTCLRTAP